MKCVSDEGCLLCDLIIQLIKKSNLKKILLIKMNVLKMKGKCITDELQ